MQSAIQLYTLRHLDESILDILDRVGETTFAGVEFATRVDEADPEDVVARLDDNDLEAVSAHVGIEDLEADVDDVVEQAKTLGYDDVVVPWLDPEHFATVEAVEDAAARLSELQSKLDEEGLQLHYHNHDQEFQETEQGLAYHILAEQAPDIGLQVDAGWVLAGGVEPTDLIHQYAERISLVHLKDVWLDQAGEPPLGDGDLDLAGVAEASRDAGAEWLIFENDQPEDPLAELESGSRILSRLV